MKNTVALILTCFVLAACGGSTEEGDSSLPRGVTESTIKLGLHTDLSGPVAVWGVPFTSGLRQRFDELAEAGGVHGRTIDLVVEDTQYQVPLAVKAVNKMLNVDGIFAMVGAIGTPQNHATFDRLFEANVPNLFPLTAARSMYEPLHPLKFSYFVSYQDQARGGIRYMAEKHGVSKVCLQATATDYGAEVLEGYESIVGELGLESVFVGRHKATETDFVGTATNIKNSDCELLFVGALIKDSILLYTAVRDAGWDGLVVANMVPYLPEVPTSANGGMEGFYSVAPVYVPNFADVEPDSWSGRWYRAYKERYGTEPAAQSVIGYSIGDIVVTALERAGPDLTVESLVAAIESIDHYEDLFGGPSVSFGPNKHVASDSLNVYQVVDRKWQTVAESIPY